MTEQRWYRFTDLRVRCPGRSGSSAGRQNPSGFEHVLDEGMGVSRLIVVPAVDRAEIAIHDLGQRQIHNRRMRIADDVGADDWIAGHIQYSTPPFGASGGFEIAVDFLGAGASARDEDDRGN